MNFKRNEKYTTIAVYAFLVICAAILVLLLIMNIGSVFGAIGKFFEIISPITYGFVIAYLFTPLINQLEKKIFRFRKAEAAGKDVKATKRVLSILTAFILAAAVLTAFVLIIVPQIADSYNKLTSQIGNYVSSAQSWADDFVKNFSLFNGKYENLNDLLQLDKLQTDLTDNIKDAISDSYKLLETVSNYVFSYAGKFVIEVKNLVIGLILSIYLLFSKEKTCARIKKLTAAIFSRKAYINIVNIARYTNESFGGFIVAKLIDSLIIGLLTFAVTKIFNIPFAPLVSLVVGVTNIIPVFGPIIGAIPTAFIVFIAEPKKCILFIIIVIVIQQLDGNVIGPKILGEKIGISSMLVIISITVMGGYFGITGMILGVPTFAVIYSLLKQYSERKLKARGIPEDSDYFLEDPEKTDFTTENIIISSKEEIPEKYQVKEYTPKEHNEKKKKISLVGLIKKAIRKNGSRKK